MFLDLHIVYQDAASEGHVEPSQLDEEQRNEDTRSLTSDEASLSEPDEQVIAAGMSENADIAVKVFMTAIDWLLSVFSVWLI